MAAQGQGPAPGRGQHFLKSRKLAAGVVAASGVTESDLVLEIGAGKGKITEELCARARMVLAVENDPYLAKLLIDRFVDRGHVHVVFGEALTVPRPSESFRAFGNVPFGITSALLRHLLDDPETSLHRADLIVQLGAAMKRARARHSNLLNMSWGPWWEFRLTRRLPAKSFDPMPSVDAAVLSIVKREEQLLSSDKRIAYVALLRQAFSDGRELHLFLDWLPRSKLRALSSELGFSMKRRAIDLSLSQWVALFETVDRMKMLKRR